MKNHLKNNNLVLLFCLVGLCVMILTNCKPPIIGNFPDVEILYVKSSGSLGFIQPDGSQPSEQNVSNDLSHPVWYQDTVYFREGQGYNVSTLSSLPQGKPKHVCKIDDNNFVNTIGGRKTGNGYTGLIINQNDLRIVLYDIEHCQVKETYVQVPKIEGHINEWILGASLSPDENHLIYTYETGQGDNADYSIRIMDLTTGKTSEIGKGEYPIWSPSGKLIAYLDKVAMYTMKPDGTQNKLVILTGYNSSLLSQVTMSWSPDDRFIVYDMRGENIQVKNIYIVELSTGKVNMIASGGVQPFWRKE
jgi:hypothetical protein